MLKKYFFLATLFLMLISNRNFAQTKPQTVDYVDLQKYSGTWYEIAKIPNSFQSDCSQNTTATYTLQDNGAIKVVNRCYDSNGSVEEAEGVARIVDTATNSKLEVSFVSFLGWRPFWGDYWIVGLEKDYKWAVVGHPERKYGWILSRTKTLPQDTVDEINSLLKAQGYNPDDFENSTQK